VKFNINWVMFYFKKENLNPFYDLSSPYIEKKKELNCTLLHIPTI